MIKKDKVSVFCLNFLKIYFVNAQLYIEAYL